MIAPPRSAAPLSTIMLLRMLIGAVERVEDEDAAAVVAGVVALDQVAVDVDRAGAVAERRRRPGSSDSIAMPAPESTESL